jgi:uncharacterized protein (TIGR02246 family)
VPGALEEIEAIKRVKARYFRLLDAQAWEEWAQVFTPDARLRWGPAPGDVFEGRDAIVAGVRRALEGATSCHHGHMPEIELTGRDSARGIWAMEDVIDAPGWSLHGWGHYHEEYALVDGAWRIRSTTLTRLRVDRARKRT